MTNVELITPTETESLKSFAAKECAKFANLVQGVKKAIADDLIVSNCELRLKAAENTYRTSLENCFLQRFNHLVEGAPTLENTRAKEKEQLADLLGSTGYQTFQTYLDRDLARLTDLATGVGNEDEEDPSIRWEEFRGNIVLRASVFRHLYRDILVEAVLKQIHELQNAGAPGGSVHQFPATAAG